MGKLTLQRPWYHTHVCARWLNVTSVFRLSFEDQVILGLAERDAMRACGIVASGAVASDHMFECGLTPIHLGLL